MKNVHLFLLAGLLSLTFSLTAQITITQDHLPVVGDLVVSAQSDTAGVSVGTLGADQTWDYSFLDTVAYDTIKYILPADAPNNIDFPAANLAGLIITEGDSIYFFLESTPDAFWRLGGVLENEALAGGIVSLPFDPKSKQFELPATYETTFTDSTGYEIEAAGTDGTQGKIKNVTLSENTIDGYGEITTPAGTFDALRMTTVTSTTDSTWIFVFGTWSLVIAEQDMSTTITYITRETKGPIVILELEEGVVVTASHIVGYAPPLSAPTAIFSSLDEGSGLVVFTDESLNEPTEWLWEFGDGETSTEQHPTYTFLDNDTYNVCLTVTNGAGTNMTCQMIDVVVVGVNDLLAPIALEVFPNPVRDFVTIKVNEVITATLLVNITDAQGRIIFKSELENEQKINTNHWPAGVYTFRVFTNDGKASTSGHIVVVK